VVAGVSDFQVSTFHSGSINLKAFLVFILILQGNTGNCIDIDICDRGLGIVLNFRLFCVKFLCVLMACLVTYVTVTLVLMSLMMMKQMRPMMRGSLFQKCSNVGG
jgi:hypothetical protein